MKKLLITQGRNYGGGGGIRIEGGVVTLRNVHVYDNYAASGYSGGYGAGGGGMLINNADVTMIDCSVFENSCPNNAGTGIFFWGNSLNLIHTEVRYNINENG